MRSALIGKTHFKVKWKGYKNCIWEPQKTIPEELIRQFYIEKGQTRKKKRKREEF